MSRRLDRELRQLLGGPPRRPSRRLRLAILGLVLAILVALFLTLARLSHPTRNATSTAGRCVAILRFRNRVYDGKRVRSDSFVQYQSIGVGTVPPCGSTQPSQYDVRSLVGVAPTLAVALPGAGNVVYVRRGRCPGLAGAGLARCLRRGG